MLRKGYATACLNYAKDLAVKADCYKMMLLTGTDETIELDLEEHDAYKWVTKEEILEMNDNDLVSYMKELMRVC